METQQSPSLRRIRIRPTNQPGEKPVDLDSFGAAEKYLHEIAPTMLGGRLNLLVEVEYLAGMAYRFTYACSNGGLDVRERLLRETFAVALRHGIEKGDEHQRGAAREILNRVRIPALDDIGV